MLDERWRIAAVGATQNIIRSYREAGALAVAGLRAQATDICTTDEVKRRDMMVKCAMTSMNSKLVRAPPTQACASVTRPPAAVGGGSFLPGGAFLCRVFIT